MVSPRENSESGQHRPAHFAPSKFAPPAPSPSWVDRPALLARLSSPEHRIGAVIGSPGSGKTVLLAQWVRSMPAQSVCWLNADQADRDPVRFWQAAIAAVRSVRPGFGQESLDLLVLDHDVHHDMLEALLAACEGLAQPVVLVIDDFQFVDASIAEHLRFLLTRGAGNLRLAIGSRSEPAISMARLRMAGDLCEIREPDLRFDRQAAGALLENLKVAVRSADLDVVMTRTEGWAAGVHLAAVALRGVDRPDRFVERLTGNNQVIADYLWAELYEAQSVDIQRFLLDTCIVDELTPALAAALSPSTPVSLAEIEEANLLLNRLDAEGRSFRYHHLLAEMLRLRLRAHDPQHELVLHERAARWHAAYGDPRVAFRHRWRAGQRTEAITSIHGTIVDAYYTNRLPSIVDTECTLADEDLVAAPGPSVSYCSTVLLTGYVDEADRLASRIESLVGTRLDEQDRMQLLVLRAMTSLAHCDPRRALRFEAEMLRLGDRPGSGGQWFEIGIGMLIRAHTWEGNDGLAEALAGRVSINGPGAVESIEVRSSVAQLRLMTGSLTDALELAGRAAGEVQRQGLETTTVALVPGALVGCVLLERGDIGEAEPLLRDASDLGSRLRVPICILARVALSRIWCAEGRFDAAMVLLESARQLVRHEPPRSSILDHVAAQQARMFTRVGQLENARRVVDSLPKGPVRSLELARVALAGGDIVAARTELAALAACATSPRLELEIAILQLASAIAANVPSDELAASVLDLAQQEGFVFAIPEAGSAVLHEVCRIARRRPRSGFIDTLLATRPHAVAPDRPTIDIATEALSERERVVLRYLATSMSYREIADDLFISVNTVKTHVKNIIRKLHAGSRLQAIERARELRYL